MGYCIVKITNPRYLTTEEEITLGAKNLFDLMKIFMKYRNKYVMFTVKVN